MSGVIVNDALRIAYLPIPKVASSSIRGAVRGRPTRTVPDGYFCFAFVRHPWDRLVSALYSTLRSFDPLDDRLAQYVNDKHVDSHVRPQVSFLRGHCIDFIGYYNLIDSDWSQLAELTGLPPLERHNVGKHRPEAWREAPVTWERWLPIYAEDFSLCSSWERS